MLTPEMLKVMAEGISRLNDGDPNDIALAEIVERQVFEQTGLVYRSRRFIAQGDVTYGWAWREEYGDYDLAGMDRNGQWPDWAKELVFSPQHPVVILKITT
jgi:hypothetical protein